MLRLGCLEHKLASHGLGGLGGFVVLAKLRVVRLRDIDFPLPRSLTGAHPTQHGSLGPELHILPSQLPLMKASCMLLGPWATTVPIEWFVVTKQGRS